MAIFRRFIDFQMQMTEKGKPFARMRPLVAALDSFFFERSEPTKNRPHIRDAVDLKRWMVLVVIALLPCIIMAIWNTGAQKYVYGSADLQLFRTFQESCHSLKDYTNFFLEQDRWKTVLLYGLETFLPIVIIAYAAGGLCEAVFACVRGHEIAEGFLVSGILFALILPPTIPYWMAAFGVAIGIIISKELFGGTGMNIVNPAMFCRIFLFFSFPAQMSGDVWVGDNALSMRQSLITMNSQGALKGVDAISQASLLHRMNVGLDVRRIHADVIKTYIGGDKVPSPESAPIIEKQLVAWKSAHAKAPVDPTKTVVQNIQSLPREEMREFLTDPIAKEGLGLSAEKFEGAWYFSELESGQGIMTNWNFFLGNKIGSFGETSILASLLGALFLIWTGIGSWRTMLGVILGTLGTASLFYGAVILFGSDGGAWAPAVFTFPPYKHLLLGGLMFGLVFMATDPVSSPSIPLARWVYGIVIGMITVIIRYINPAYPEGVMLAIITANVMAPLLDHYAAAYTRSVRRAQRA